MPKRVWVFTLLAAVVVLGALQGIDRVAAGDGSVRFLSAGPVLLADGHIAHMRVFIPAVQRPVRVHFLGGGGEILGSLDVEPPAEQSGPVMELNFAAKFEGTGQTRFPTLSITDGTSNTILSKQTESGIIAILIGLRQGTGGMGTMHVTNAAGETVGILPYIEQDNLFRLPALR